MMGGTAPLPSCREIARETAQNGGEEIMDDWR